MTFIIPYMVFVFSFMPQYTVSDDLFYQDQFMSEVVAGVEICDIGFVEGEFKTLMEFGKMSFAPYQQDYNLRAGIKVNQFTLGVEHTCYHPVESSSDVVRYKGGYNRIYLEYDTRK